MRRCICESSFAAANNGHGGASLCPMASGGRRDDSPWYRMCQAGSSQLRVKHGCHGVTDLFQILSGTIQEKKLRGAAAADHFHGSSKKRCRSALRRPRAPCWAPWLPRTAQHGTRRRWPSWQRSHSRRARCARARAGHRGKRQAWAAGRIAWLLRGRGWRQRVHWQ